ncbi:hypothetical protein RJ640_007721 [Escallonia rubra]|uniref:F-box domain-containing protein n=1 Tax=Escallonia rubra TaxID=112253 RepID=A0AA88U4T4_9ASTE|nr:hypothetical protein RJ640_007721 [Escallonia rubra]
MASSPRTDSVGPTVPSDLVHNILSRLPVKALGKFKSVSKQWHTTITDPFFLLTHRESSLQNPNLVLLRKTRKEEQINKTHVAKTHVEASSVGFDGNPYLDFTLNFTDDVDLLPSKWDLICFVGESGFYVCNPSTQEMVKLPEMSACTSGGGVVAGMGYDSSSDEYVFVHLFDRVLDVDYDNDFGCEVLRLRDGGVVDCSWKVAGASCPYDVRGWGVLVGNAFYWMIWDAYDHPGNDAIVSFDLEREEFSTIRPPRGCLDPEGVWFLVELGGCLCLVDNATRPLMMDIWVMNDRENHEWVKEYNIYLDGFSKELLKFIIPLDNQDGEILMDAKQEKLCYYDTEDKRFSRMCSLLAGNWTWLSVQISGNSIRFQPTLWEQVKLFGSIVNLATT